MTRKVALVTGGAQGLGAAVCRQFAARGWSVAIADINESGARNVAKACGEAEDCARAIPVDLGKSDGPERMVDAVKSWAGRVDVLVNCAAAAPAEAFIDMTARSWEVALAVNVKAVALS